MSLYRYNKHKMQEIPIKELKNNIRWYKHSISKIKGTMKCFSIKICDNLPIISEYPNVLYIKYLGKILTRKCGVPSIVVRIFK